MDGRVMAGTAIVESGHERGVWQHCANSGVRRAARQLGQLFDDMIEDSGLRATQFSLLAQIRVGGRPALGTLAALMVMDLSALGHTLKPLLRDGLVSVSPDDADRRVRRVALTAAGEARLAAAEAQWRRAQQRFEMLLGAEDAATLQRILGRVASAEFGAAFRAGEDAAGTPVGDAGGR